jgi:hypothetical protein
MRKDIEARTRNKFDGVLTTMLKHLLTLKEMVEVICPSRRRLASSKILRKDVRSLHWLLFKEHKTNNWGVVGDADGQNDNLMNLNGGRPPTCIDEGALVKMFRIIIGIEKTVSHHMEAQKLKDGNIKLPVTPQEPGTGSIPEPASPASHSAQGQEAINLWNTPHKGKSARQRLSEMIEEDLPNEPTMTARASDNNTKKVEGSVSTKATHRTSPGPPPRSTNDGSVVNAVPPARKMIGMDGGEDKNGAIAWKKNIQLKKFKRGQTVTVKYGTDNAYLNSHTRHGSLKVISDTTSYYDTDEKGNATITIETTGGQIHKVAVKDLLHEGESN